MRLPEICLSERGHPLVYWGPPMKRPVLTVENYLKWYDLYLVMPDGSIRKLEWEKYMHLQGGKDGLPFIWADHAIYPPAYERICEALDLEFDYLSFEVVVGRWVSEQQDGDFGDRVGRGAKSV